MSSKQQKILFVLIFLAFFIPFTLNGFKINSPNLQGPFAWGVWCLTAALSAALIVAVLQKNISMVQSYRNTFSPDLSNIPLAPPATFRIDKAKAGKNKMVKLEGVLTKGTLQKGMGFKISDDSGIAISFLGKLGEFGIPQFLAQVGSEDGSLVVLARLFGNISQNDFLEKSEIEFSDAPEFRAQAAQSLSLHLSSHMAIAGGVVGFLVFLFILSIKNPDDFHRLISLFHH